MEEIITLDGKQFKLTVDRPLTALEKEQVLADIRKQTGCGTCGSKVARMGNDWQYGGVRSLLDVLGTAHCPLPLAPGGSPGTAKVSGDTVTLASKPTQGVAPYKIEFRMTPAQSMTADTDITTVNVDDVTDLIPEGGGAGKLNLGELNTNTGVTENTTITVHYTISDVDINGATKKPADLGPTLVFASKVTDSCSTAQLCVTACKIYVACPSPTCDFTVS